eukprot:CAMPEP_0206200920 /NCGR_PEP_ID=MMETSP0166-20121206/11197_1 /ASSEMBLY_ACC=CAM_ASM_000260 /TAXON_ID=95228 /ORGANISM="Vannella robusta, Strain DIVA3 518/3/11/1/6" /LENGTH=160 /DNA_ID=CAMNT_0053619411 /DNA_START=21 /DNA_END=500 /DNA_ORIENTATION=-
MKFISQDDMDDILTMLEDPEVYRYLYFAPGPADSFRQYFNPFIEGSAAAVEQGKWPESLIYIIRDDESRFMGMAAITAVAMHKGNYEVGYQLPKHAWRKGIASTACSLLTALAFNTLGAHKVTADCYGGNLGSRRVLEKSGFLHEGTQEGYYKLEDEEFQ